MKASFYICFCLLFFYFIPSEAQNNCACAICGRPCNEISLYGHYKGYSCYTAPAASSSAGKGGTIPAVVPKFDANAYVKQELTMGLVQGLLNFVFMDNSKAQKAAEQQKMLAAQQAAAIAAQKAAELKRIKDSIDQVNYDKMMKLYKLFDSTKTVSLKKIDDSKSVTFKGIDDKPFKPLPIMGSTPLTAAEIFNLRHGIHYDPSAMNQVTSEGTIIPEIKAKEEDVNEKFLEKMIDKVGEYQAGKFAALGGTIMLNIKRESFSYLQDVSTAITSGDMQRMQDLSNIEVKSLYVNAMNKTLEKYGADYLSGKVQETKSALNVATMKAWIGEKNTGHVLDALSLKSKANETWETYGLINQVYQNNKQ